MPGPVSELGVPALKGKVSATRGRYYVTIGRSKKEVPVGQLVSEEEIKNLVGKEVRVVSAGHTVAALGTYDEARHWWRWILCYLPAPELIKELNPVLREVLLKKYLEEKIIPKEIGEQIHGLGH